MNTDDFFQNLFDGNGEHVDAIRFQRQLAFEERTIKRVFTECGIKFHAWGRLVNDCSNKTGLHKLNFEWFNTSYRFPAVLCGKRIPKLFELSVVDMLRQPKQNKFFKTLIRNIERQEIDVEQSFVFVFPIVQRMFCAHNISAEHVSGIDRVSWRVKTDDLVLTIEPTASFFGSLGSAWFSND